MHVCGFPCCKHVVAGQQNRQKLHHLYNPTQLSQDLLWSDPMERDGYAPSPRGALGVRRGVLVRVGFGRGIETESFLTPFSEAIESMKIGRRRGPCPVWGISCITYIFLQLRVPNKGTCIERIARRWHPLRTRCDSTHLDSAQVGVMGGAGLLHVLTTSFHSRIATSLSLMRAPANVHKYILSASARN